jgi:hypothetical protein
MVAAIGLLLTVGLIAIGPATPQASQQHESGVVVVKKNWRKGVRGSDLGRSIFNQPAPSQPRNSSTDDPFQRMRQSERRIAMRVDGYYYITTVRNEGSRPVKALLWDYTITTPGDPSSLTHHQFYSRVDIRPGKHKEIYRFSVTPPTRTVSAGKPDARLFEEVVVRAVQYKDGSIWKLQQKPAEGLQP